MNAATSTLAIPVSDDDHIQGPAVAAITLVEYGDYQCPACGMAYPEIKRIQRKFDDGLRFVFRNFPLSEAHPLPAAEMAEACSVLDHFWPMHDWLYENQEAWTAYGTEGLEAGLRALGIDEAALTRALGERDLGARIRSDFIGGVRSGVNGTPCFFVNGYRYDGDIRTLSRALEDLADRL